MDTKHICQSCSMPMADTSLYGTEKDGSLSTEYCKYCYQHGQFTRPGLTLDEMIKSMTSRMDNKEIPSDLVAEALARLPYLKRWQRMGVERERGGDV